jgi:hypothetical protein
MAHDNAGIWIGYGLGDSGGRIPNIQHRLLYAYPAHSNSILHGVIQSGTYDLATQLSVMDFAHYCNATDGTHFRTDGICDYALQVRLGAYVPPRLGPKYPMQGVYYNSNAFLAPDPLHNYVQAITEAQREGVRLYSLEVGTPIIALGYSMGGDSVKMFMRGLPPEWRQYVKLAAAFGDPARPNPDVSTLLVPDVPGADGPGWGISRNAHDTWYQDRLLSFGIDHDWYPRCRTEVLALLYRILTRAALTLEFASYLFSVLPTLPGQILLGATPSDDPAAGALAGLAPQVISSGSQAVNGILNPLALFTLLPQLVELMIDAVQFAATNTHGMYGDPAHALWDGRTAVDYAVEQIRQRVPGGAKLYLFGGTWAMWNQGFQFDTAMGLQAA